MSEPHSRLNEAMNNRRLELGMTWNKVAAAAKNSPEALRAIRRGDYKPSELTAQQLEQALQWGLGTMKRLLSEEEAPVTPTSSTRKATGRNEPRSGDDPTVHALQQMARHLEAMQNRLDQLTQQVNRLLEAGAEHSH